MPTSHKLAVSDGDGRNQRPSWVKSVTDSADCKREEAAIKAMLARESGDRAEANSRAYNQKRVHQQPS